MCDGALFLWRNAPIVNVHVGASCGHRVINLNRYRELIMHIESSFAKKCNGSAPVNSDCADSAQSEISREFHNFLADIEDLVKKTTLLTGAELDEVKNKLNERIATAKTSVEEIGGEITHRARKSVADTNRYVHEQSWTAIGIGTAVGLLLGLALSRRS